MKTRKQAAAETRDRLLDAAREVFIRRGYEAASIYEIAEDAGRTIGALYGHFGSKEGIFLELLDRHFAEQIEALDNATRHALTDADAVASGASLWRELLVQERGLFVLFLEFWAAALRDPEIQPRFAESYRTLRAALAGIIEAEAARRHVRLRVSTEGAAIVFDAFIDGFALHKLVDPDAVPDDLLLRGLSWLAAGMTAGAPAGPTAPEEGGD